MACPLIASPLPVMEPRNLHHPTRNVSGEHRDLTSVAGPLTQWEALMLVRWTKVTSWMQEEKGASMVEYALLVFLIAIV